MSTQKTKATVNGKDWAKISEEMSQEIVASSILEYASNVEHRLNAILGSNYSIELNVGIEDGQFLSKASMSIHNDTGEVISRRDGVSFGKDCNNTILLSIADAATRYSVPHFTEKAKTECKVEQATEQPSKTERKVEQATKKTAPQKDSTKKENSSTKLSQEQKKNDGSELLEFIITSDWARTKLNQFWCSVHHVVDGEEKTDSKSILVISEDAQKLIYSKLDSAKPTENMSVISPTIYEILKSYGRGAHFRCVAQKRERNEYILVDLPN